VPDGFGTVGVTMEWCTWGTRTRTVVGLALIAAMLVAIPQRATAANDTTRPVVSVDHAANTEFTGPDVTLTGTATDNVGVTSARLKIRNRDTGQWLQADGTWDSPIVWHDTTIVDDPDPTNVAWAITLTLSDGRYNPVSEAGDAAGNTATQTAFRPIAVTSDDGDPPDPPDPPGGVSWRIQRCLWALGPAVNDPELTQTQKDYLQSLCDGDIAAEAIAEPQGALAPEIFPDHKYQLNDPTAVADRFGHSLHCMDTSAERFALVAMPTNNPGNIDLTKPGGSAPLNYPGEFMLAEVDGRVRLFHRVVFWQVRPDNQPVQIKHQILYPGNENVTVARVPDAPRHEAMSIWTEIEETILQAWNANMNSEVYDSIIPGKIMNIRTWYADTNCHDKRGEVRIPQLVLDYAVAHGFADGPGTLADPTSIRLESSGDPNVGGNWSITTRPVSVGATQYTNGYRWYYADDD